MSPKHVGSVLLLLALTAQPARAQDTAAPDSSKKEDPNVRAVISAGVSYLTDDHEDYTKNNGALLVSNDSKVRASGLAGALFRIGDVDTWWGQDRQLSIVTSFQFTQGSSGFLDGFFLGGAVEMNPNLHFTGGFGLRKGKELAPGFRAAAAELIAERAAANDAAYRRFVGYDRSQKDEAILDGLPLNTPGKETPFFPGEPIVDSYNWSIFFGVSVPVKVTELFGGGTNGSSNATEPQAPASTAKSSQSRR